MEISVRHDKFYVCILVGLDLLVVLSTFTCEAMELGAFGIVVIIYPYDVAYV